MFLYFTEKRILEVTSISVASILNLAVMYLLIKHFQVTSFLQVFTGVCK